MGGANALHNIKSPKNSSQGEYFVRNTIHQKISNIDRKSILTELNVFIPKLQWGKNTNIIVKYFFFLLVLGVLL